MRTASTPPCRGVRSRAPLIRRCWRSSTIGRRDHARLADGLRIPVERVRTAAARSLVGYVDDGQPLTPALQDASLDALLNEIRRRVESSHDHAQSARDDDDPPGARACVG